MKESDFYPAGAYSDPNAPYNECEPPEIELDVTVEETLVRSASIVTKKAWYVRDEEGYTELEADGLDAHEEYEKDNSLLSITICDAHEEIARLREEAERRQRQLEEHYGVKHGCIPGVWLPEHRTEWYSTMRRLLIEARDRVRDLKRIEAGLDGWEHSDIDVWLDD